MGKSTFAPHTRRFANAPRKPCLYAAELAKEDGTFLKVGVGSNAVGRLMSLQSEVKRVHGADIRRFAIFTTATVKAAYEAETKVVDALMLIAKPIEGRREFFHGVSFDLACGIVRNKTTAIRWTEQA